MAMALHETWDRQFPSKLHNQRIMIDEGLNLLIASNGKEPISPDGDGLCFRASRVYSHNLAPPQDQIRSWAIRGSFWEVLYCH
jgi:hypothetical protein